jgi:hypothetical protein
MNFVFLYILYTLSYFTEQLNKSSSLFPFDFGRLPLFFSEYVQIDFTGSGHKFEGIPNIYFGRLPLFFSEYVQIDFTSIGHKFEGIPNIYLSCCLLVTFKPLFDKETEI